MGNEKLLRTIFTVAAAAVLVTLPLFAGQYTITTCLRIMHFGLLAISVGFLIGQGGMVSFSQTAFFGFTGYVIGLLGLERGLPFPLPELIGLAGVIVTAALLGMVALRAYKIVFLMITLAIGQIFWAFAQQNTTLLHGWAGIRGIRPPVVLGIDFQNPTYLYWAGLVIVSLAIFLLWRITKSPFGLALNGIRESPRRMAALGYPVYWLRLIAFVIAAFYAGLGGILAVYTSGIITPTAIQLSRTIWILLMVILGGASYFWGPVVGTIIGVWLDVIISGITGRYNTIIGIIFVIVVLFSPNGILGLIDSVRQNQKFSRLRKYLFPNASPGKQNRDPYERR